MYMMTTLVPNMVTAVLADYRGYDTMFETVVVFIAGIAIFSILGVGTMKEAREGRVSPPAYLGVIAPRDLIIRITCRLLVPVIQIFALYVLAHGHHSPGGGFQGGVIMAASFIMMDLSSDLRGRSARLNQSHDDPLGDHRDPHLFRMGRGLSSLRGALPRL